MKERERNKRLLTLLDGVILREDEESFELIKTMVDKDTESMQKSFEIMEKSWEELKLEEAQRGPIKHEDLSDIYCEEGFDKDFEFIGKDGTRYTFNADHFQYLIEEYRAEHVRDCISTTNGSLKDMIAQGICHKIDD